MVLVLPTIGEQLGPGIDKLIEGINHVINPDYGFQQAMKARLASDPDLVGKLSDLEANAPGTLKKLGFGPLAPAITGTPESAGSQIKRETRGQQVATGEAKANLDLSQVSELSQSFANDPALRADFVSRALRGENLAQYEGTKAAASEQGARARILNAQEPGIEAKAKFEEARLQKIIDDYPALSQINPVDIAKQLMNGQTPANFQELMQIPGFPEALTQSRLVFEAQANRDMKWLMLEQRKSGLDAEYRQNVQRAGQAWIASGMRGTPKGWLTLLTDPEKAQEIAAKPGQLTPDEQGVKDAINAQVAQNEYVQNKQMMSDNAALRQAQVAANDAVKKASTPEGINLGLAPLNNLFEQNAEKGGELYRAVYGRPPSIGEKERGFSYAHPFTGPAKQVYYVNSKGVRVDETEPFAVRPKLDSESYKALTALNSLPPDKRQTEIARMKAGRPDVYAKIKDFIK